MAQEKLRFDTDSALGAGGGRKQARQCGQGNARPQGQYVVLHKPLISPTVTNDGVTITQEIELEDIFENQAAQMVKEVATKTKFAPEADAQQITEIASRLLGKE